MGHRTVYLVFVFLLRSNGVDGACSGAWWWRLCSGRETILRPGIVFPDRPKSCVRVCVFFCSFRDYSVCMLVPDATSFATTPQEDGQRRSDMPLQRRRLRVAGEPVPQHCGGQGPAKKCFGDGATVDSKQRNRIELLSQLTRTPEPNLSAMEWNWAKTGPFYV